jgi:type II secretory pathway pseudopilin PulG
MALRMPPIESAVPSRSGARGFTYLWVLLAVALVGMGLTLAADVYRTSLQREHEAALLAIGHEFRAALRGYYLAPSRGSNASPASRYPASLVDLLEDPRFFGTRRHQRKIYVDPVKGQADWGLIKMGDRIVGIHSLSERVPIKQGNFDAEDLALEGRAKLSDWWFTYPADLRFLDPTGQITSATSPGRSK